MLILGAKGFAVQLLDVLEQLDLVKECVFFDDQSGDTSRFISRFEVIKSKDHAFHYLQSSDGRFTLGTGKPSVRSYFFNLFRHKGFIPISIISPFARIGKYDVEIGEGCSILTGAVIESTVKLGKGVLVNLNATVTHGCRIGDFCELSPGVHISGDCTIGANTFLGTGSVVLPKVSIGDNVVIGAGSVVTKDIPSNALVKGVPGRINNL